VYVKDNIEKYRMRLKKLINGRWRKERKVKKLH